MCQGHRHNLTVLLAKLKTVLLAELKTVLLTKLKSVLLTELKAERRTLLYYAISLFFFS